MGAGTPTPKPTATPTPTPKTSATATAKAASTASPAASAPQRSAIPMVVVFPFQTSSELKPDTGGRAAQLFVQQINGAGGIDAINGAPNIQRTGYLSYAQKLQADYYVTGYMTPLGAGVSLVEQVVSTQDGTIVYGNTAQIDSFDDASAQAIQIHGFILSQEQADADRYAAAQAESTASAPPSGNQANFSKGISDIAGLFKRRGQTPKPVAVVKPAKGVLVVHASGSVPEDDLNRATSVLYTNLNTHFNAHMTTAQPANVSTAADGICGASRDNTIATGSLSATVARHGLTSRTQWTFKLDTYTCFGAKLTENAAVSDSLDGAVKAAVEAYAAAHPENT